MSEIKKAPTEGQNISRAPKRIQKEFGLKELALVAGLSTLGSFEAGCKKDEGLPATRESSGWLEKDVEFSVKSGDWEFFVFGETPVSLSQAKERNFHDWLWNFLGDEEWFKKLPEVDRRAYVDGLIAVTRRLNSGIDLDSFAQVKNSSDFKLPIRFLADPNPIKPYSKSEGGYSRLQDLALADGFDLRVGHQQEIFDTALSSSIEIPESVRFYLDREGSEDSQPRLAPDVVRRLDMLGGAFEKLEFAGQTGWNFSVTDVMRDPVTQSKRQSVDNSTHVTGRSFDISNGRFQAPDGRIITWSAFEGGKAIGRGPDADLVERMRPQLVELSKEYGVVLFTESSHWHSYVPKARKIDLHAPLARYLADETLHETQVPIEPEVSVIRDEETQSDQVKRPGVLKRWWKKLFGKEESEIQPEVVDKEQYEAEVFRTRLSEAFLKDYQEIQSKQSSLVEVDKRLIELRPATDLVFSEAFPGQKVLYPYLEILKLPNFSPENRATYGDLSFDELLERTASWRLSKKASDQKKWRAISQAWLKDRTIELIRCLPQSEIERLGILEGTTLHSSRRPPFYDLLGIWRWKSENKTNSKARKYVDTALRLNLGERSNSVDIGVWYQKQQESIDLLRRHSGELRFRSEVTAYLTPEVMLSVINAEFFSELDGRTFVDVAPVVFAPYNIVFGPAVNDGYFSSGPVQLIESTFTGYLKNDGTHLRAIKASEGSAAKFIVPKKVGEGYDTTQVVEAMVGDADSVIFYASFSVAEHTKSAFNTLFADEDFCRAWEQASDEDRELFVGTLAPLAINGGGGTARSAAKSLLADQDLITLRDMAKDLPTHTKKKFARRGAEVGYDTMVYLLDRAKEE